MQRKGCPHTKMLWSTRPLPDPQGVGGGLGRPGWGSPRGARVWRADLPTWARGPRRPALRGLVAPCILHTHKDVRLWEKEGEVALAAGPEGSATPTFPGSGSSLPSEIRTARIPHLPHSLKKQPAIVFHPCTSGADVLLIPGVQDPVPSPGAARGRRPENSFQPHLSLSLLGRTCLPRLLVRLSFHPSLSANVVTVALFQSVGCVTYIPLRLREG